MNAPTQPPQIIRTEAGDELVVLTRRAYDVLLARAGDDDAEDRMAARMTQQHLADADDRGPAIAHWFAKLVAEHGSSILSARKHAGLSRAALARAVDMTEADLRRIERDEAEPTAAQRRGIASATGLDATWLI